MRRLVKKAGCDSMLVTDFVNVSYLTGFTGDDSYLLLTANDAIVLSDSRYDVQLKEECPEIDVVTRTSSVPMMQALARTARRCKTQNMAFEADTVSVALHGRLADALPKVKLSATEGWILRLREIKDADEVKEIRGSIRLAEKAFAVIRAQMRGSQTEREIAANLEQTIRQLGGKGCSFAPIVAVGPRAALPHANPTERRVEESDFVLIDWGATRGQYLSDLTRILATGRISPKLERIYGVVLQAQERAIAAIRPGAVMSAVDAAARKTIAKAGHAKHFGHGLGHGFGLEIHEQPRLSPNDDRPLQVGMVVTVEPGIYLPGWGGVRIEDDVLVTRTGCEVLTSAPKQMADCIVS